MIIYRICPSLYAEKLDGLGPKLYGGRWNRPGVPCIYTSASRALALLEYSCHVPLHLIPRDLSFVSYEITDHSMQAFPMSRLPGDWQNAPHTISSQLFGSRALTKAKSLVLQFPSVVINAEMNYIINSAHPDASSIRITEISAYSYDVRVKKPS